MQLPIAIYGVRNSMQLPQSEQFINSPERVYAILQGQNLFSEKRHAIAQESNLWREKRHAVVPKRTTFCKQRFAMLLFRKTIYENQSIFMLNFHLIYLNQTTNSCINLLLLLKCINARKQTIHY